MTRRTADLLADLQRLATMTPEELEAATKAAYQAHHAKWVAAKARSEVRWAEGLAKVTPAQSEKLQALEADEHKMNKIYTSRTTGLVLVLLVGPEKWHTGKQRTVRKLVLVYPDGTVVSTQDKAISIAAF